MSTGQHTPLSRLRAALGALPEDQEMLSLDLVDQVVRIIRGAPEDKTRLLRAPVARVQAMLETLPEEKRPQALELLEQVIQEAHSAAKAKGLARTKAAYRMRLRVASQARQEALDEAGKEIASLRYALKCLTGPGHVPPPEAKRILSQVARPPIQVSYWTDDPWVCLRIEERTIGHHREQPYIHKDTGRAAMRSDPESEKWMRWIRGLAQDLEILPAGKQVREVFFPGLAYTFMAWMELPNHRPEDLIHPMDPDNVVKSTNDALQTEPYKGEKLDFGAYKNDTQILDLLIFRLPQSGAPPVDRIQLNKEAKKKRKEKKAQKEKEAQEGRS